MRMPSRDLTDVTLVIMMTEMKMKMKMMTKVADDDSYLVMKVIQSLKLSSDECYLVGLGEKLAEHIKCSNFFWLTCILM